GVILDREVLDTGGPTTSNTQQRLVPDHGTWQPVAATTDLGNGQVAPFQTGSTVGFVVNKGGTLQAVSRICTHQGCLLPQNRPPPSATPGHRRPSHPPPAPPPPPPRPPPPPPTHAGPPRPPPASRCANATAKSRSTHRHQSESPEYFRTPTSLAPEGSPERLG